MKFPIHHALRHSWYCYDNLSEALQEALQDRGIINAETGAPSQDYFELPIESRSLLTLLCTFFDLEPEFHVGCSTDERPPSFCFSINEGSDETRKGGYYLGYTREIKRQIFFQHHAFRKASSLISGHVRDLDALAQAYNHPGNYNEDIFLGWGGWCGKESDAGIKSGFYNLSSRITFEESRFRGVLGLEHFIAGKTKVGGPLFHDSNPFYEKRKGMFLFAIAEEYEKRKTELPRQTSDGVALESLQMLGYSAVDIVYGFLQMARQMLPCKQEADATRSMRSMIESALAESGTKPL